MTLLVCGLGGTRLFKQNFCQFRQERHLLEVEKIILTHGTDRLIASSSFPDVNELEVLFHKEKHTSCDVIL